MKKKDALKVPLRWNKKLKTLIIMKLLLFNCFLLISISANVLPQGSFSLSISDKTFRETLKEIENNCELHFFYNEKFIDLDKTVNLEVANVSEQELLEQLFKDQMLTYQLLEGNLVVITPQGLKQEITIKGKVTDFEGNPLPGVNVVEKETTNGTITDFDGNYIISVSTGSSILLFSYVGYLTEEVEVGDKTTIDLTMIEDIQALDEVVVIGYGTVKKSDLTGSVTSLKREDLNVDNNTSIDQMIQGRSAGVQVIQESAEPGGGMAIRIRGAGSINAGSSPLYVIDGMPIDNGLVVSGTGEGVVGTRTPRNPLSSINPADIESIEILKDASATAIYGARGANGVIIVTTKKGKEGRLNITYTAQTGIQTPANKIDLLEPEEYMSVLNDIFDDGGGDEGERVTEIQNGGTDWQDELMRNAMTQSHGLSLSGGKEQTNYFASINYYNQEGVIINSGFKRYDARLNLDHEVNRFKFGVNFTTSYSHDDYVSYGYGINENAGSLYAGLNFDPTLEIFNDDGTYQISPFISIDNPLALANHETSYGNNYRTMGTVYGEYSILPEWKVKLNIGIDAQNSRRDSYVGRETKDGGGSGGIGSVRVGTRSNYLFEGTTTYNKELNQNNAIAFMTGITYQGFNLERFSGSGKNFPTEVTKTNSMGAADPSLYTMGSYKATSTLFSVISRLNYTLLQKYLFTATFRADGSSKFGENNKYGYFPSFAFAWKLHEEDFIQSLDLFSQLKFRASWGSTGNQAIGDGQSVTTFVTGPDAVVDDAQTTTLAPSRVANPDLKWETTTQTNFGVDFAVLENRIYATVDYFQKNTTDMLIYLPIPPSSGFPNILQNIGSIKNTGFEFMINSRNLVGEFKWETTLNFSTVKNEVTDLGPIPEIVHIGAGWSNQIALIQEGEVLNSFYGYNILGVWQEDDDFTTTTDPVAPGDLKYEDINDDGQVNSEDRMILGNSFPDVLWGMSNNFSYKGFTLNIFFEGAEGLSMLNNNLVDSYFPINFRRNKYAEPYLNRWTPENPSNEYPSFVNPNGQGNKAVNSYTVEDASYIRLKTLKLSYDFSLKNTKVFKNASVYLSAQNLATFTDYSGMDPANNSNGNPSLKIDYNSYPLAKTYLAGLTIGF